MRPKANAVFVCIPASARYVSWQILVQEDEWYFTFEEINSLVGNEVTSEVLGRVHTTNNECAVAVSALEKFQNTRLLLRLLQLNSTTHHGDGLFRVLDLR